LKNSDIIEPKNKKVEKFLKKQFIFLSCCKYLWKEYLVYSNFVFRLWNVAFFGRWIYTITYGHRAIRLLHPVWVVSAIHVAVPHAHGAVV
jgi:hypothetical protein